jgi:hypothetical protein
MVSHAAHIAAAAIALLAPAALLAQTLTRTTRLGKDSVTIVASNGYKANAFHRFLFGDNYRDIWATTIRVPVLDLREFGGGLTALKTGGSRQTINLRLKSKDGSMYVFRPVYKSVVDLPSFFKGTVVWRIVLDERSAQHPAGATVTPTLLSAAGVLRPGMRLAVMPDDSVLGKFRELFANSLGTFEDYPDDPEDGKTFADAQDIIDGQDLWEKLNQSASNQVDARTYLASRLVDILVNDNDRHAGQLKWARLTKDGLWTPIPRDRDKVFLSHDGFLYMFARKVKPTLVDFGARPGMASVIGEALEVDQRILFALPRPVWDSVAASLVQRLNDAVIDSALAEMPPEYAESTREIAKIVKGRRDLFPQIAREYYDFIHGRVLDLHATDENDRLAIVRHGDGKVSINLSSQSSDPYFTRTFDPAETAEIRVYLHNGDDVATVTGDAPISIKVRIIGGNGTNTFADSSSVGGSSNPTAFYEEGHTDGVHYEFEDVEDIDQVDATFIHFNRRPLHQAYGHHLRPAKDYGVYTQPVAGMSLDRTLGLTPRLGWFRQTFGFRKYPYATMIGADVSYATSVGRYQVRAFADKRFESSDFHLSFDGEMQGFAMTEFRGFGNTIPDLQGSFYDVRMTQWNARPSFGLAFGPFSDVSIGPVVRYTKTDSSANRFISQLEPYGFRTFGQMGAELRFRYDSRPPDTVRINDGQAIGKSHDPRYWGALDLSGATYPAMWDVQSTYSSVAAYGRTYLTLPLPLEPMIALRGGGKKLYGDFPFFDAAFLGYTESLRTEIRQRYAGDASLYGSAEIRVPIARFPLFLPWNTGLIGFSDIGRVYFKGDSPGGWHRINGGGIWLGLVMPGVGLTFYVTDDPSHRTMLNFGFAF